VIDQTEQLLPHFNFGNTFLIRSAKCCFLMINWFNLGKMMTAENFTGASKETSERLERAVEVDGTVSS